MSQELNVLVLEKAEENYIFLWDDQHTGDALRTLGRFASNPELSLSWMDAAVLSGRMRAMVGERGESQAVPPSGEKSPERIAFERN